MRPAEMQSYLAEIEQQKGLRSSLDALFDWSLEVGYITQAKLQDNPRFAFKDAETGVTFTAQINVARSRYSPKPLTGQNIPKLHCPICIENVGIPGKENLRVYEFTLGKRAFFLQLTPFPLVPRHFVLVQRAPEPMCMSGQSVADLMGFIDRAPGYVGCSNSDVEWAGASILVHHHYQVFDSIHLPIMEASSLPRYQAQHAGVRYALLHYPIATVLLESKDSANLINAATAIIATWKAQDLGRNTCNLVVLKKNQCYQVYVIFRNPDHRTSAQWQPIKSEGVGVIEVAGEGIYPVPSDPSLLQQIEQDGLSVIKGIIMDNNPVPAVGLGALFLVIEQAIQKGVSP